MAILKDEDGNELARQITNNDATYSFDVVPFEDYTINAEKDDFKNSAFNFKVHRS